MTKSQISINSQPEDENQVIAVVLGMHRSGTSLITNILSKAGFFVGEDSDLIKGNRWNRDGYFEQTAVCAANDQILQLCGGSWHEPPEEKDVRKIQMDYRIQSLLNIYKGHRRVIIKDPRMCITFPVWDRILSNNVRFVRITRKPDAVAASLNKRFGFPPYKGLYLWQTYEHRASIIAKRYPFYAMQYEDLFSERRQELLNKLSSFLGLEEDLDKIAAQLVDPSQQHHRGNRSNFVIRAEAAFDPQKEYETASRLVRDGAYDEAISVLEKIVNFYPGHSLAQNDLGVLYNSKGDIDLALYCIKNALQLEPNNATFQNNLSRLRPEPFDMKQDPQAKTETLPVIRADTALSGPWWDYQRFRQDKVKVLLVSLHHLLLTEIRSALERLGHTCKMMLIAGEALNRADVECMFTKEIRSFHPDFVLTVNHLGFDHEGVVTGLLTRYKIPFASWYVDSPHLIIRHFAENRSPYLTLFLWDKDYIEIAKRLGFEKVEYLPLGVDDKLFHHVNSGGNHLASLASDVSFVGNSMVNKVRSKLSRCGIEGPLEERFEEVSAAFEQSHHLVVRDMLAEGLPELASELEKLPEPQALGYETSVTWQATGWYREALVKRLRPFKPLIVGDSGWREILDDQFSLHSELNYYDDLPAFYSVTRVSFDATSRQMKNGVNQRVFDVPACRGVVVTDWTLQLEDLMEPGREIIAYRDGDEIPELVDRAIRDREFRKRIVENGYSRVLNEHTYCHRVKKMIDTMKQNYQ